MNIRRFGLSLLVLLLLSGCSGQNNSGNFEKIYENIISSEKISVEEAYDSIKDAHFDDAEKDSFVSKLKDLYECSGVFVQTAESGNRYTADISFYLVNGDVFCSTKYSGYMGTINDGPVTDSQDSAYRFQSKTTGSLYGREQDFLIYFGNEKLRVTWAGVCDESLIRSDGSVEGSQDYRVPFEESDTYASLVATIDEKFAAYKHHVSYNESDRSFNIYFEAPEGTKQALETGDSKIMGSWKEVSDSMNTLSNSILTVVKVGDHAEYVNLYWVGKLNDSDIYSDDDLMLWTQNGKEKQNYADHVTVIDSSSEKPSSVPSSSSLSSSHSSSSSSSYSSSSSSSSSSSTWSVSSGDRQALQMAQEYLNAMAFSYSGLIDQLEFEGFTHSEAVYAADNCGADWYEQAALMAREYLNAMSFSRSGLKEQLEFEGFTSAQAEYGVNQAY